MIPNSICQKGSNENMKTRSAFVSIVGCPNVGKSSLLNEILGQKIAIVSNKPQTTRTQIMGVWTEGELQLIFTDTPGLHRAKNKLSEHMIKAVTDSVNDVDMVLFVTEPKGKIKEEELELISRFQKLSVPVLPPLPPPVLPPPLAALPEGVVMSAGTSRLYSRKASSG